MFIMKKISFFLTVLILFSCSSGSDDSGDNGNEPPVSFDREAMLTNWAENIIVPAYSSFINSLSGLEQSAISFADTPSESSLQELRDSWLEAYKMWQHVSMFDIGKAEEIRLRDYLNIYPLNVNAVNENIVTGNYDLSLLSKIDEQGFPALDYLLNGLGATDTETLEFFTIDTNADNYKKYLTDVVDRMVALSAEVLDDWNSGYITTFVSNSGTTSGSAVNKLVNDYVKYFEKSLRSGKIGIPAGAFSGTSAPEKVEAYYKEDISKELFFEAFNASKNFFEGKHFNSNQKGESLKSYLDFLNTIKDGEDLSALILNGFDFAEERADELSVDFANQVETDNPKMLATFDALQEMVVLFKVDMMQAMNISVDFVDADGD